MSKADKWMPMYWADLWKDTAHLSAAQRGAYYDLIGAYWNRRGPLPSAPDQLMRLARCTEKEWRAVEAAVTALFQCDGEVLRHKRIDRELAKADATYNKRLEHITALNRRRQGQSLSQEQSPEPQPDSHPSGEAPAPKRKSAIPTDWHPNAKDIGHATDRGIDRRRLPAIADHFRDHHTAKRTLSADWSASWRTWIANELKFNGGGGQPRQRGGGTVAALREILFEDGGALAGDEPLRQRGATAVIDGGDAQGGAGDSGCGDDAGAARSGETPAGRVEAADRPQIRRHGGRDQGTDSDLRPQARRLSSGCGADGAADPARSVEVLAGMGGTEGTPGRADVAAAGRAEGADVVDRGDADDLTIPAFLRRTA